MGVVVGVVGCCLFDLCGVVGYVVFVVESVGCC